MSGEESRLDLTLKAGDRLPSLFRTRSSLVARGRKDVAAMFNDTKADTLAETRRRAEEGYCEAQIELAESYYLGKGIDPDHSEAAKWFRRAAEQGHPGAQFCLGRLYDLGHGVSKDQIEGTRWLGMAAEQGNSEAQFNLGFAYYVGEGVQKDEAQAAHWFREAADRNNPAGQHWLGLMYAHGPGVSQDRVEAYKWLHLAATNNRESEYRTLSHETRDMLGDKLTAEQLAYAQRMATDDIESHRTAKEIHEKLSEMLRPPLSGGSPGSP